MPSSLQRSMSAVLLNPESARSRITVLGRSALMDFYKDYPQCEVAVYYKTPMSKELKSEVALFEATWEKWHYAKEKNKRFP